MLCLCFLCFLIFFSSHRPTWVHRCPPSLTMSIPSLLLQPPLAPLNAESSTRTYVLCHKEVRNRYQWNHVFSSAGKDLITWKHLMILTWRTLCNLKTDSFSSCPNKCMPLWGPCMRLCFRSASSYRTPGPAPSFARTLLLKLMTYVAPWLR